MKMSLLSYISRPLLTKRPVAWCIVSLASLLGTSYFLERRFGFLAFLLLAVVSIFIGGVAVIALRSRNRFQGTRTVFRMKNMPQITSGWDYRPRDVIRGDAAVTPSGGAEMVQNPSSSPATLNESDDVWFNFINPETTVEEATQ
jgi:hypothetical protein